MRLFTQCRRTVELRSLFSGLFRCCFLPREEGYEKALLTFWQTMATPGRRRCRLAALTAGLTGAGIATRSCRRRSTALHLLATRQSLRPRQVVLPACFSLAVSQPKETYLQLQGLVFVDRSGQLLHCLIVQAAAAGLLSGFWSNMFLLVYLCPRLATAVSPYCVLKGAHRTVLRALPTLLAVKVSWLATLPLKVEHWALC